ncbi:MAG: GGDEF domain-containing protein [Rhodoferax sp.]|nr:GGDEF domain-containing protein [Rhodoferax sp.]
MPGLGNHAGYINRPQRRWLVLSVALVLGLGALAWINHELTAPALSAPLVVCVLVMVAISLVLSRRLQLARAQRDRALARASAMRRQMSELLLNQDLRVEQGVARRVQGLQNEIADLRATEMSLRIQAHHDDLTGLANRILLADRFHSAVERAKRSGKSFALLMIDLNDFKTVNDDYGHAAGDAVLVTMARRLVGAVRASDTVARLGGDEFVLIVESFEDPQELVQIGLKLVASLSDPITLDPGVSVSVSASVGLGLYPDHGADMNDLLCVADHAMYECKSTGQMSLQ